MTNIRKENQIVYRQTEIKQTRRQTFETHTNSQIYIDIYIYISCYQNPVVEYICKTDKAYKQLDRRVHMSWVRSSQMQTDPSEQSGFTVYGSTVYGLTAESFLVLEMIWGRVIMKCIQYFGIG